MPGIWNVNNGYNMNTRKVSSKLTFEVGEKFTGRVVDKGEGKDVMIKLSDGWQFIAEVDGNINLDDIKLVKFQVEGFENGKLKLKVVKDGTSHSESTEDENFNEVIEKEGLSKEDVDLLKNMVKHNFSLTKENINKLKAILQFSDKVKTDSEDLGLFVNKYLESKGIDVHSEQGKQMKELLSKFISEFKNMSEDDILTFIENNIDFSEENIESFNKLFKGDSSIEKILSSIKEKLNASDIKADVKNIELNDIFSRSASQEPNDDINVLNKSAFSKVYADNDPANNKIDVLNILKTLAGENSEESEKVKFANADILDKSIADQLSNKETFDAIKEVVGEKIQDKNAPKTQASSLIESLNKSKVEDILSKAEGKEVKLTDDEFKKITEIVQNKEQPAKTEFVKDESANKFKFENVKTQNTDAAVMQKADNAVKENTLNKSKMQNSNGFTDSMTKDFLKSSNNIDNIKNGIKSQIDNVKDIVKEILTHTTNNDSVANKVANLIKENINDIKVFNSMSNEYYCLNFNVSAQMKEYPCKLIIKDNRKEGKKIDTTNAKMVLSIKTSNLGEIDGYLTMKDRKIDVDLKCDDRYTIVLDKHKKELADGLSTLGVFVNIKVAAKKEPADIVNSRAFFNDITISAIDTMV